MQGGGNVVKRAGSSSAGEHKFHDLFCGKRREKDIKPEKVRSE